MKFKKGGDAKAILLGAVDDDYVLGVICQMVGIVDYALFMLDGLKNNPKRIELFTLGRREAKEYEWRHIAYDLWKIRHKNPANFDAVLGELVNHNRFTEVMDAIKTVTTESIKRDNELTKRFLQLFKERIKAEEKGAKE